MQHAATKWDHAEDVEIEDRKYYLVKTNGGEWRDVDLKLMPGVMLRHYLKPNIVRGRPIWVAEVNEPTV